MLKIQSFRQAIIIHSPYRQARRTVSIESGTRSKYGTGSGSDYSNPLEPRCCFPRSINYGEILEATVLLGTNTMYPPFCGDEHFEEINRLESKTHDMRLHKVRVLYADRHSGSPGRPEKVGPRAICPKRRDRARTLSLLEDPET